MPQARGLPGLRTRRLLAAALVILALGPETREAAAGSATASFQVTARLAAGNSGCRGAGDPVTLACGSPQTPTILQTRPELTGTTVLDGWITYGNRSEAYDSVYAASLTTRVIRYQQWEYIETLVSW